MARVNPVEVQAIMSDSVDVNILDVFIKGATLIVDNRLTGSGLDDATLKEIERWLTAHMVSMSDQARAVSKEKVGDVAVEYTGQFGKGLQATTYGQMVLSLDTSGIMSTVDKKKASLTAIKSTEWR